MSAYDIPQILIWLIVVVIFLVILFWLLDRFLVIDGGILLYADAVKDNQQNNKNDEISKGLKKYCEEININNALKDEIICKLKK